MLLLLLSNPVFVNDPKTEYADAQRTEQTVTFTQAGWDIFKSQSDIMAVMPSIPAEDISAPNDWWNAKNAESSTVAFMLV